MDNVLYKPSSAEQMSGVVISPLGLTESLCPVARPHPALSGIVWAVTGVGV